MPIIDSRNLTTTTSTHTCADQTAAPQLQAAKADLEKAKITDILAHKIEARPEKDDLVQQNILKGACIHTLCK